MGKKTLFLFLAILAIAVFFRLWNLTQIPPGLYPDIAVNGTNALDALKTHDFKLFYPDNNGREGLFINLIALSLWLLGPSAFAIKFAAAIIGILTVIGFFFFARAIFRYLSRDKADFIALLATFLLAVAFWHVNFSRIGFRAVMVPFILVWAFYFLSKAIEATQIFKSNTDGYDKKIRPLTIVYWLLAGIFFGLGFNTYISYRTAPLILLPPLIFSLIALKEHKELFKKTLIGWVIFFVFAFATAAPIGYYFLKHPQDFMGRSGQVSVFSSSNPLKELLTSAVKTAGMFNVSGDCNWRQNDVHASLSFQLWGGCQPELLWPVGIFFLVGLGFVLFESFRPKNWRQKNWQKLNAFWLLLFMFLAMLLPEILSMEGVPHALRAIGAIVPVFIFAGLGLALIFWALKKLWLQDGIRLFMLYFLLFATILGIGAAEFNKYFLDWGVRQETKDEFSQLSVDEANYMNSLPDDIIKYVLVNEGGVPVPYPDGIPMPAQTIMFLTYGKPNIKYLVPKQGAMTLIFGGPSVLLPMNPDNAIFNQLKQKFPDGKLEQIQNEFSVFKLGF